MSIRPLRLCEDCTHGTQLQGPHGRYSCAALDSPSERPPSHCLYYSGGRFPVDIVLITAVQVEHEAVLNELHSDGRHAWDFRETTSDGRWQTTVIQASSTPEMNVRIALGKTRMMGLSATASLAALAIQLFRPSLVVMPGITAGRKDKTSIGDIIIPQQIWDYGAGKWEVMKRTLQFTARPEPEAIEEDIRQCCERIRNDPLSCQRIFPTPIAGTKPTIRIGSAASGAAVVNAKPIWERVRRQNDTIIALDMEAYGLALATRLAKTPTYRPEWLICKSVCDYGHRKWDDYQEYAARASVRFFKEQFILGNKATFQRLRHNIPHED